MEILRKAVVLAGQMHGSDRRCNDYDKAKVDEMRRAQKRARSRPTCRQARA